MHRLLFLLILEIITTKFFESMNGWRSFNEKL